MCLVFVIKLPLQLCPSSSAVLIREGEYDNFNDNGDPDKPSVGVIDCKKGVGVEDIISLCDGALVLETKVGTKESDTRGVKDTIDGVLVVVMIDGATDCNIDLL